MFALAIPLTLFIIFVLPVWLWLHYRNRATSSSELSQNERQHLLQLIDETKRIRERIQTLEAILDVENPNWRESR